MWPAMVTRPSKRKRNGSIDLGYSDEPEHAMKKILAFRSPPSTKPLPITTRQPTLSRSLVPSFLTPVDSDDDFPFGDNEKLFSGSRNHSGSQSSSDSSPSSIRALAGDNDKMDLFLSPPREPHSPLSVRRQLGRPRSNGMLGPPRYLHDTSTQSSLLHDRAPTPINQRFPDSDIEMSDTLPPKTVLSPMIGDLPSPGEEADQMMSDFHFNGEAREYSSSAPSRSSNGQIPRTARLHMGYRADCDKCRQRVPGHYTHILWS